MATPAVGSTGIRPARPSGRLGSDDFNSGTLPIAQEAAVLYAANHAEAAVQALKAEIKDAAGRNNKQAWLMLFDLYQAAPNRQEFDALAMLYTVKFEQSPPPWAEAGEAAGEPRRNQSRERKDFFALKPGPGGELAAEIEKFLVFAEDQGTVRLDVAKVTAISPEEAVLLANALIHLRKKRAPMWFNNFESLEKVLRAAFNEKSAEDQRPYWALLFEVYILLGRMEQFEELGLEFAVAFEMSPPSWEVYENKVSAAAKAAAAPMPACRCAGGRLRAQRRGLGGERQPDRGNERPCRGARRGRHRHEQRPQDRFRLHVDVLRRHQGDPARRQARDPRGAERAQRGTPGGARCQPLCDPGAAPQLKSPGRKKRFPRDPGFAHVP